MAAKKTSRSNKETTLRHIWLAGLGAVSVARREAKIAAEIALDETAALRQRAMEAACDTRDIARGIFLTVQEQVEPKLGKFAAEVEAVLAPLIEKFGLQAKPARPARKARKPAAKKASPRSASARKHADVRVVRKGR